ncbi:MAG: hypothetical protein JXL97_19400 [Bacteroidales bacterium]|nr:hypothetical protein [Bacteroidales bacterium]
METISEGDRVKYIGEPNHWTFEQNLERNSKGTVVRIFPSGNKINYEIKFDNGILTTIDIEDLDLEA